MCTCNLSTWGTEVGRALETKSSRTACQYNKNIAKHLWAFIWVWGRLGFVCSTEDTAQDCIFYHCGAKVLPLYSAAPINGLHFYQEVGYFT